MVGRGACGVLCGCRRRWCGVPAAACAGASGGGAGCLRRPARVRWGCGVPAAACAGSVGVPGACGGLCGFGGGARGAVRGPVGRGRAGGCPSSERRGIGRPQKCPALTRQPLRADTPRHVPFSPYATDGRLAVRTSCGPPRYAFPCSRGPLPRPPQLRAVVPPPVPERPGRYPQGRHGWAECRATRPIPAPHSRPGTPGVPGPPARSSVGCPVSVGPASRRETARGSELGHT